jgi:hypothetical protein
MTDRYTFADSVTGLQHAFDTTLNLRRHGYKTRLATRELHHSSVFTVHTVLATPPARVRTAFQKFNTEVNRGR